MKTKQNFLEITKYSLIKTLINPLWFFIGYVLPILFVVMYTYSYTSILKSYPYPDTLGKGRIFLIAGLFISVGYFGLLSFNILMAQIKQKKVYKIYSTLNISYNKLALSNLLINFIHVFIINNILIFIYYLFLKGYGISNNLNLTVQEYFGYLFLSFLAFFFTFLFSYVINLVSHNNLAIISVSILVYVFFLTTSGSFIPPWIFNKISFYTEGRGTNFDDYKTFYIITNVQIMMKWFQYITPIGAAERLSYLILLNALEPLSHQLNDSLQFLGDINHNSIITNGYNIDNISTFSITFASWNSDWLTFVVPVLEGIGLYLIVYYFPPWRYHNDVNDKKIIKNELSEKEVPLNEIYRN